MDMQPLQSNLPLHDTKTTIYGNRVWLQTNSPGEAMPLFKEWFEQATASCNKIHEHTARLAESAAILRITEHGCNWWRQRSEDQAAKIKDQAAKIKDQVTKIEDQATKIEDQATKIEYQGIWLEDQALNIEDLDARLTRACRKLSSCGERVSRLLRQNAYLEATLDKANSMLRTAPGQTSRDAQRQG
jgi:chromosome segregation ATPase